ncbi:MAG TPA: HemK/PrmC family methyltransferase [Anaeromyxobacteraceae bacterium]|nr:HemK/PrmC family methyltransferase [Anaeromyxobacteraceae bacterium]
MSRSPRDEAATVLAPDACEGAAKAEERTLQSPGGSHRFFGLDLMMAEEVLVPRQETELLAKIATEVLSAAAVDGREVRFLDLCCGAGNLACALAAHVPSARGWATDLTSPAVELTRRNIALLGLSARVQVVQGDLLAPLAGLGLEGTLDALLCNPPYISTGRLGRDRAELLSKEPREAFDGGPYGLTFHQRVAREAAVFLRPGAPVLLEIGAGQEKQVLLLLKRAGFWEDAATYPDAGGIPRVVMARRRVGVQ